MVAETQTAAPEAELGILFVHGIGEQHQGQTLIQFADPISSWLARWLTHGHRTEAAVGAPDGTGVSLEDANLGGDEPAHLFMTVTDADELSLGGKHRWLLAESWWAETFFPPRTTTLLLWMLLIAPYVTLVQFYELRRHARRPPSTESWPRRFARRVRILAFFLVYLGALPLAALVALLVAVLLVGMLIPVQQIQDRAKKVALLLANTVGDSFVLVSSAVQFDAMVSRVGRDLAWLADKAEGVVVVAHSQGTAVSYAALDGGHAPANLRAFVTVGEAIKKLRLMRGLQSFGAEREPLAQLRRAGIRLSLSRSFGRWARLRSLRFGLAWLGLLGIYLFAYAVPQLVVVSPAQPTHVVRGLVYAIVGAAFAAFVLWICQAYWLDDVTSDPSPIVPLDKPVHWADFYASADPVPNGPLFSHTEEKTWLVEKEVWNFGSIVRDHTGYTSSEDDFLGCVVGELVGATGRSFPDDTKESLRRARWRGWWRVWWLTAARFLAVVAAVVTVVRVSGQLTQIGDRVSHWHWWSPVKTLGKHAVDGLRNLIVVGHPTNAQIVGVLTVVLVGAAGYVLLAAVWAYWQRQDVKRFYRRFTREEDTDPLGGRDLLLFLFTLSLEAVIAFSIWWTGDYAYAWNWAGDHKGLVVAIVVIGLGAAPIAFAWMLRDQLRVAERFLIRMFPREGQAPEAPEAVPAPTPAGP